MDLQQIVDKLNANCLEKENPMRDRWHTTELSWDIDDCKNYCYSEEIRHIQVGRICSSCEKILEREIRNRCDKTITELNTELQESKEEILSLRKKVDDLASIIEKFVQSKN
jgi:predicted RNase H-like nuclease (RuvC/YqgF family)